MHPFTVPPRFDDAAVAEVGQVSRNQRLAMAERARKRTYANLPVAHEVQEPQASLVTERQEQRSGTNQNVLGVHAGKITQIRTFV